MPVNRKLNPPKPFSSPSLAVAAFRRYRRPPLRIHKRLLCSHFSSYSIEMQVAGVVLRSSRAVRAPSVSIFNRLLFPDRLYSAGEDSSPSASESRSYGTSFRQNHDLSVRCPPPHSMVLTAAFCSGPEGLNNSPTEAAKEIYDKMLSSIKEKRSAPPNAWMWSLIENCKNKEDIVLLFSILQNLRIFRLSNLRIHDNFNCNLCQQVTKACLAVGAIDFAKKALWTHNVYGLSPSVASANHILSFAKNRKDAKIMVDVMKLIKRNDLPLQPSTADIVFSICYETDNWDLVSKYSRRFLKAGVKLRKTTFGSWMSFAAKRGDTESLWEIEKLRSDVYKGHNLESGFACAKGLLLERKPEDAASMIQLLDQSLADSKKPQILIEVQKLVSEWPAEVLKLQKREDCENLAAALKADIPAMVSSVLNMGVEANVNLKDLDRTEALLH